MDATRDEVTDLYSLIGTAKLHNVYLMAYLRFVLTHAIANHAINRVGEMMLSVDADWRRINDWQF